MIHGTKTVDWLCWITFQTKLSFHEHGTERVLVSVYELYLFVAMKSYDAPVRMTNVVCFILWIYVDFAMNIHEDGFLHISIYI